MRTLRPSDGSNDEYEESKSTKLNQQQQQIPDEEEEDLFDMADYAPPKQTEKRTKTNATKDRRSVANQNSSRDKKSSLTSDGNLSDVYNQIENAFADIAPVASSAPPPSKLLAKKPRNPKSTAAAAGAAEATQSSRPKMIHTQKMRVPVEDGKRKTKTLITRSVPEESSSKKSRSKKRSKTKTSTSNASQQYIEEEEPQQRQFEHIISIKEEDMYSRGMSETNLLLELSKKSLNYSPDVVNDLEEILRSPIKSKDSVDEPPLDLHYGSSSELMDMHFSDPLETTPTKLTRASKRISSRQLTTKPSPQQKPNINKTTPNRSANKKQKSNEIDEQQEVMAKIAMNIKQEKEESYTITNEELFTCEMCSEVFRDRAQLLVHVPIHI